MTRDDAISITEFLLNAWARPEWTQAQIETFVDALTPHEADIATQAMALAHKSIKYRPTLAEFLEFYRAARSENQSRSRLRAEPQPKINGMPTWVKRWACARYFHNQFDREQDMRRFIEQAEWADPALPVMSPEEWATEAARIEDRNVLRAMREETAVSP